MFWFVYHNSPSRRGLDFIVTYYSIKIFGFGGRHTAILEDKRKLMNITRKKESKNKNDDDFKNESDISIKGVIK
ncbi:MAG TPA: hypothetical protein VJ225_03280 [Nitrososphaeraceae archaeon]|nr:hypothetical protein [Nitrososphaeraceae archaeon]